MSITEDATITSKGQVTIPKRIRDQLDLDAGTEVEFVLADDETVIVKQKKPAMEQLRDVQQTLSKHDIDIDAMIRESKEAWSSLDGDDNGAA